MKGAPRNIAIIGAGWAGCSAAVTLSQRGHTVSLYEAARVLGGRARTVEVADKIIDNGQHLLLGAYTACMKMLRAVGQDPAACFLKLPLQMCYAAGSGGMDFVAPPLPAPWHMLFALLRATGLEWQDKLALARFFSTLRWMGWRLHHDCSVSTLLDRNDQTARLIKLLWRPLCLAALNTPPDQASAQIFLNVLRDSLGAGRTASDMLIPRSDLSSLFPQQAAGFVLAHGGSIHAGTTVKHLTPQGGRWLVQTLSSRDELEYDGVIIATGSHQAARLLPVQSTRLLPHQHINLPTLAVLHQLTQLRYEPITTCYLQYDRRFRLPRPFMALLDDPAQGHWGQFVFDRGQANGRDAGLLAVVISASHDAASPGKKKLSDCIAAQIADVFPQAGLPQPGWSAIITEKQATFSCRPGLNRPPNQTGWPGLLLAGDYTDGAYPGTLESAVRSGIKSAELIAESECG